MNTLKNILLYIISQSPQTRAEFDRARHSASRKFKTVQPSNNELLSAYQKLLKKAKITPNKQLEYLMRKAAIRTMSGVAIVTSLTEPYACPGKCVYCPTEARMPKSYLSNEPAAARALGLNFDPYEQMARRIEMLKTNGHPTDKIEFIVKGGSWNAYPLEYQYNFILQSFKACNEMKKKKQDTRLRFVSDGQARYKKYSISNIQYLTKALQEEQTLNETARHRIIGLTLETRPDLITPETIYHMRQMGCTRVELGLQAPDDKILKLTKRGHTVQQFKDAMLLLRQAGFKVDLHFMPGLPGSTARHDVEMYKQIFSDPGLKPDMIKIYPCSVIKNTELYKWYKQGKYKPYSQKKLIDALIEMKLATPRYCRISRLIRDIPEPSIEAGNKVTNLRQNLVKEMQKRGLKCKCLRCREVGHQQNLQLTTYPDKVRDPVFHRDNFQLFIDKYKTVGGTEYFLSFEDKKRQVVFAFCRLRLPQSFNLSIFKSSYLPALIRELHTYGQMIAIGKTQNPNNKTQVQHKGLGKKLMAEAEKIAKKNKFKKISVISGVGVRGYYRKLGYRKEGTYMTKKLS